MNKIKSFFTINRHDFFLILLSAVLLFLSFPWFKTGFLSFVAVVPFLFLLRNKQHSFKTGFKYGYWFGFFGNALVIYWLANNIVAAAIAAVIVNAFHYALVFGIFQKLKSLGTGRATLLLPFLWVVLEYTRNFGDLKFNWLTLAHTMTYYISFIQPIEYTGMYPLSFMIIAGNLILFYVFSHRRGKKVYLAAMGLVLVVVIWELWGILLLDRTRKEMGRKPVLRVGVVQPNIDPWEKWTAGNEQRSMKVLMQETRTLLQDSAQLIIWPETATPFYLRNRPLALDSIRTVLAKYRVPLLTGTLDYKRRFGKRGNFDIYNAAFFINPFFPVRSYNKIKLVPGAEELPFKFVLGWLSEHIDLGQGDFIPGTEATVFSFKPHGSADTDTIRLACGICFDSTFPDLFRRFIRNRANLLSVITNDGWFGTTTGPYQHWQLAVLRAVESRRSIARCANTGISGFIAPTGETLAASRLETRISMIHDLPINSRPTFYSKNGDLFPVFCGIFFLLLLSLFRLKSRVRKIHE